MDVLRYHLGPLTTLGGVVGFLLGGPWVWLGIAGFPVLLALDLLLAPDHARRRFGAGFAADLPLYLHVLFLLALYPAFLYSVATGLNPLAGPGSGWQVAGSILSIGWLSAVPNVPVVHEFWHRRNRFQQRLGYLCNVFFMDLNRDIGHVKTHHLFLDTARDSDTAERGENVYRFVLRATLGGYMDAIHVEAEGLRKRGRSPWNWRNRAWLQLLLLAGIPAACAWFGGAMAALVCVCAMLMGKVLAESFNYHQHYGLVRLPDGSVQKHHAWNHLGAIVRPLGFEITNHINHHLDSYTRYHDLRPEPEAPQMPSLFACFVLGFIPPLYFALIAKPRLKDWDERFASPAERRLAMQANQKAGWPRWVDGETDAPAVPRAA